MSNVLIGIIGVILFIGLALAGALILGDDFSSASNSSKAARVVQTLQQVSSAANMYRLKTGRPLFEEDNALLVPRFLKTYPDSPIVGATADRRLQVKLANTINDNAAAIPGAEARYVTVRIYYEGEQSKVDICRAIQEQATGQIVTTLPGADGVAPIGCGYFGVTLYAWARI